MQLHCIIVVLTSLVVVLQVPVGDAGGNSCSPPVAPNTRVLLDSYANMTTLTQWTFGSEWSISDTQPCFQSVMICNASTSQENLLVTTFVSPTFQPESREINVFVEYTCPPSSCNTNFSLLIYETSIADNTGAAEFSNYVEIESVVENATRTSRSLSPGMGFYLAFQDTASCVEITRVQVLDTVCAAAVNTLVQYVEVASSGASVNGMCVDGASAVPESGDLSATCRFEESYDFTSSGSCQCMAGRQRRGNECVECAEGFFKGEDGNSDCAMCAFNFVNEGMGNTECIDCAPGYKDVGTCSECETDHFMDGSGMCAPCPSMSTSDGGNVMSCNCIADYYSQSGTCIACPSGSMRPPGDDQSSCQCETGKATMLNDVSTTVDDCNGCVTGYFNNGTVGGSLLCVPCPSNSESNDPTDTACTCTEGAVLPSDPNTMMTTTEPCSGCNAGFYRDMDSNLCPRCPPNSVRRESTDPEAICECSSIDFRRSDPTDPATECLPLVGFGNLMLIFEEGANKSAPLILSASSTQMIQVPIVSGDLEVSETVIAANKLNGMVRITIPDDEIALENNATYILNIPASSTPLFVVPDDNFTTRDGRNLYRSTTVTIVDDDFVDVGFTDTRISVNESAAHTMVTIQRIQAIASELRLRITPEDATLIRIPVKEIVLTSEMEMVTVMLTITDDSEGGQGEREVILGLEYSGPADFFNSVRIGGGDTNGEIVITVIDDDPSPSSSLPLDVIIGACAGGAGIAVLFLLIIIVCLCICRLRVNRRGFYHTYEDKTSEPPTMLRYSASLRSISSQTVIPVTEGRSVQKENEFYV